MKYRARRQATRNLTPEQERDLLVRQRDKLLRLCREREKWCPTGVAIREIYEIYSHDPDLPEEE